MSDVTTEARPFLLEAGYQPQCIQPDYEFTYRTQDGLLTNQVVAMAAFGALPRSIRTACIAFARAGSDRERDELFPKLRFLAAPLAIIFGEEMVQVWSIRNQAVPLKVSEALPGQWKSTIGPMRDFSPEIMLSAKNGAASSAS